jgi:HlyD family secretion protein
MRCVIVAVAVGLITTGALAATASHHPTYRTATVTRAAVNETLERTGTIEPVSQATVAFPTNGTISDVDVAVGDTVATGQTLAKLDTTSLQATLTAKESALANAELILHKALNGESSTPSGGNGGGSNVGANTASDNSASQPSAAAATTATTGVGAKPGPSGGAANAKVTAARNAVTKAETAVRVALTAAQRALATATQACNTTTTTTSTTTPSTTTTTVPATPPTSCSAAQAALLRAQQKVADAETTLATAENKLAGILASTTTPTGGGSNTTPSTPTNTTPKASGSTITADQLVADEANVAAALADVNVANETLAQSTIVSPIAGTIADVKLSAGTQVSADSSTANVVIIGRGGYEVTTTITVADRPKVSVGDTATVTPDGSSAKLAGKVVSIGLATTSSSTSSFGGSSSTTSYPVTIGFTSEPAGLRNGASTAVTIVVAHTDSALTVPTSAVTTIGTGFHTVTVLADGKTSTVSIQIGTVGADRTAVTSGLSAGQTVVLADLGQAIPSSNTTTRFGGGGAFTGGGLGGGGFGGGSGGFGRGG